MAGLKNGYLITETTDGNNIPVPDNNQAILFIDSNNNVYIKNNTNTKIISGSDDSFIISQIGELSGNSSSQASQIAQLSGNSISVASQIAALSASSGSSLTLVQVSNASANAQIQTTNNLSALIFASSGMNISQAAQISEMSGNDSSQASLIAALSANAITHAEVAAASANSLAQATSLININTALDNNQAIQIAQLSGNSISVASQIAELSASTGSSLTLVQVSNASANALAQSTSLININTALDSNQAIQIAQMSGNSISVASQIAALSAANDVTPVMVSNASANAFAQSLSVTFAASANALSQATTLININTALDSNQASQIAALSASILTKADSANVVHLTGNENISGNKTFENLVIVKNLTGSSGFVSFISGGQLVPSQLTEVSLYVIAPSATTAPGEQGQRSYTNLTSGNDSQFIFECVEDNLWVTTASYPTMLAIVNNISANAQIQTSNNLSPLIFSLSGNSISVASQIAELSASTGSSLTLVQVSNASANALAQATTLININTALDSNQAIQIAQLSGNDISQASQIASLSANAITFSQVTDASANALAQATSLININTALDSNQAIQIAQLSGNSISVASQIAALSSAANDVTPVMVSNASANALAQSTTVSFAASANALSQATTLININTALDANQAIQISQLSGNSISQATLIAALSANAITHAEVFAASANALAQATTLININTALDSNQATQIAQLSGNDISQATQISALSGTSISVASQIAELSASTGSSLTLVQVSNASANALAQATTLININTALDSNQAIQIAQLSGNSISQATLIVELSASILTKADNANVVHLTGNENISGNKTFENFVIVKNLTGSSGFVSFISGGQLVPSQLTEVSLYVIAPSATNAPGEQGQRSYTNLTSGNDDEFIYECVEDNLWVTTASYPTMLAIVSNASANAQIQTTNNLSPLIFALSGNSISVASQIAELSASTGSSLTLVQVSNASANALAQATSLININTALDSNQAIQIAQLSGNDISQATQIAALSGNSISVASQIAALSSAANDVTPVMVSNASANSQIQTTNNLSALIFASSGMNISQASQIAALSANSVTLAMVSNASANAFAQSKTISFAASANAFSQADSLMVHRIGAENISGIKYFHDDIYLKHTDSTISFISNGDPDSNGVSDFFLKYDTANKYPEISFANKLRFRLFDSGINNWPGLDVLTISGNIIGISGSLLINGTSYTSVSFDASANALAQATSLININTALDSNQAIQIAQLSGNDISQAIQIASLSASIGTGGVTLSQVSEASANAYIQSVIALSGDINKNAAGIRYIQTGSFVDPGGNDGDIVYVV